MGELEREGRRIVLAGQELVDQGIERKTAPGGALADRLPQRERLDARLHAHGEGFGKRTDEGIARHIMDELGHGRAERIPDVRERIRLPGRRASATHAATRLNDHDLASNEARGSALAKLNTPSLFCLFKAISLRLFAEDSLVDETPICSRNFRVLGG
jgi:hypothetical protein